MYIHVSRYCPSCVHCIYAARRVTPNTFTPERYRLELDSTHTFTWRQGLTTHTQCFGGFLLKKHNFEAAGQSVYVKQSQS